MDFIQDLTKCGASVYLVGGAVRDILFNYIHKYKLKSKDFDLLVSGLDLESVKLILTKYGPVKEVGKNFGVITFRNEFDIALPRKEKSTGPKHTDFEIITDPFISIEVDLSRRDATMNSIAILIRDEQELYENNLNHLIDPFDGLIDPFDGLIDIQNKIWKTVGDPYKRFLEDPIRIMRALKQCAWLDLELCSETKKAIIGHSNLLKLTLATSASRLVDELVRLLDGQCVGKWIDFILTESGIGNLIKFNNTECNKVCDLLDKSIKLNFSIDEKMTILLLHVLNKENVSQWTKTFSLSACPHFPKHMIRFILSVTDCITLLDNMSTDNNICMRWLIVKMFGPADTLKLIKIYKLIHGIDNDIIESLVHDNMDVILSANDMVINGNDLMNRYNIDGKSAGAIKKKLFADVIDMKVLNDKELLFKHTLSCYPDNVISIDTNNMER
jgi:tRNA nucleotidyltransferase/poly(A) polymerase